MSEPTHNERVCVIAFLSVICYIASGISAFFMGILLIYLKITIGTLAAVSFVLMIFLSWDHLKRCKEEELEEDRDE